MRITPRVIEVNKKAKFTLNLKNPNNLKNIDSITIYSKTDYFHKENLEFNIVDNDIKFEYKMPYLGEFGIKVEFNYKEAKTINLYCLDKTLASKIPLKGDLHMHSTHSDGKRTPFAMALACLEAGMDFIAITDHDNYKGSQEAIKKVKENDIDLIVLPGEEISIGKGDTTLSKGNGHMLSINASCGIEEQRKDDEKHIEELEKIAKKLKEENLPADIDPLHYARNIWAINKVKEANGLAILCHPHWIYYDEKYHLHQAIYKELLTNSKIDGVEVIGDIDKIEECNNLTYITYLRNKNKYKDLAAIGNTDAHDSNHDMGCRYSIVFAKDKTNEGVVEAIDSALSVAVLKRSENEHQVIANEELSSYALFLIKEFFPKHEKLRYRVARLHLDALINNYDFSNKINNTKFKFDNYFNEFFGK